MSLFSQEGTHPCLSLPLAEPPQIVPFSFGSSLDDDGAVLNRGDYAHLTCIVRSGDLPVSLSWSLQGEVISSELGISTGQMGPRASILSIEAVDYRHRGRYICTARNAAGTDVHSAELRVNGTYRNLCWEFTGRLLAFV